MSNEEKVAPDHLSDFGSGGNNHTRSYRNKVKPIYTYSGSVLCLCILIGLIGICCVVMESITLSVRIKGSSYGVGLWAGFMYFAIAVIGGLALEFQHNSLAITAMIVDGIGAVISIMACVFALFKQERVMRYSFFVVIFSEKKPEQEGLAVLAAFAGTFCLIKMVLIIMATCTCCRKDKSSPENPPPYVIH